MDKQATPQLGQWSSQFAFILAATGAAVGLGNIWKFPYIAGENGGGAFVLVYLLCILLLGIPIMTAEIMIGRRGRQNPANTIEYLSIEANKNPSWCWMGFIGILAGFLILSYYSVIAGWALDYVFQAMLGHFQNASAAHINHLFNDLLARPFSLLAWHSLIMLSTVGVVALGVEKGLERSIQYLFPSMLFLLLVISIYSFQTGFFGHGLSFLFEPDWEKLSPNAMLIALGHAFFTLSLATGSIMMYGAYLPKNVSIPRAALFIATADTLIALLAGLAIFPIVFANGLAPGAGPGLIFKTLPIAFGHMPYGQLFATLFFIMLVFAAFTSAISLLEPSVAFLIERLGMTRLKASLCSGFLIWFLGLGTILSFSRWEKYKIFGLNFFDALDYLTANLMLPLGGLFIAVFAGWLMHKTDLLDEMFHQETLFFKGWRLTIRYISPAAVIIVLLNFAGIIHI